jgi:pyruvate/2-oxoglutarate dehydrogenase complex dihydrolipoamide dehydrogenase (E3) component
MPNIPGKRQSIDASRRELLASARPSGWRNPRTAGRYDLVVLGAGPAGLAAADSAVEAGAKVALIERHLLGGVSLLTGSVPSKAIIRTSRAYADMRSAQRFGALAPQDAQASFMAAMERMQRLRARLGAYRSAERLRDAGVALFFGEARFIARDAVAVGDATIHFAKAIIATGARPAPAQIPGLEEAGYFTSEEMFDLPACPPSLLVVGGGPLGCELAQSFCRLGSRVAIAQNEVKFLPMEERDAAQLLSEALARDGVEIHLNTTVVGVRKGRKGVKLVDLVSDDLKTTMRIDDIVIGVGRSPNVEELDLQQAGVAFDSERGVQVDDCLCTTNPRIYAAGDVCLQHKFTHAAEASAQIAVANAIQSCEKRWSAVTIPWCTYTDPEIAHVGLHVREAREQSIPISTFTVMMHDTDRAILDGEQKGFVKIHVRDGGDEILGATIVASHAGEMINEITLAIHCGIGLARLAQTIHAYPTQAGAIKAAAEAFVKSRSEAPAARGIANPEWPAA